MAVQCFNQYEYGLPTGCEITTFAMYIYSKYTDINPNKLLEYLCVGGVAGVTDPNRCFIGHPSDGNSYEALSKTMADAVNKFFRAHGNQYIAYDKVGKNLNYFITNYIQKGKAVAIWATIGMKPSYPGTYWHTPINGNYYWPAREYCLLLTGADDSYYYLNDSMKAPCTIRYPKSLVEKRYNELGKYAVIIEAIKKPIQKLTVQQPTPNNIVPVSTAKCFTYNRDNVHNYMIKYCKKMLEILSMFLLEEIVLILFLNAYMQEVMFKIMNGITTKNITG